MAGPVKLTWVFDPVSGTWSDTGFQMKEADLWFGYTSDKKYAYVAGGTHNLRSHKPTDVVERFNPSSGWKKLPSLPEARLAPGMGLLGSSLAVFGGSDPSGANMTSTLSCQTPCSAWSDAQRDLNTARSFFGFGYDAKTGTLFAAGGSTGAPHFKAIRSSEKTT